MNNNRYPVYEENVERLKKQFHECTERYLNGKPSWRESVTLKARHSWMVRRECLYIADELGLSENEKKLCDIAGLYHDIGRYEQFARYETFVDMKSENHAALGVDLIEKEGLFEELVPETRHLLIEVIGLHNRAEIPDDLPPEVSFFTRLLRDADKIDIYRVVTSYYERENRERNSVIEYGLPDTPGISEEVYEDLKSRHIVSIHHVKNFNDLKMLQLGWIYDVNFAPAFRRISERNYLEKIRRSLPDSEKIDEIFDMINQKVKEEAQING